MAYFGPAFYNDVDDDEEEFPDVTSVFVDMLKDRIAQVDQKNIAFGVNIFTQGLTGSGKTCFAFCVINLILKISSSYTFALYNVTPEALELIRFYAPVEFKDRIICIERIAQAPKRCIILMDEMGIHGDLYSFFKKDMRILYKNAAIVRHKRLIIWVNCQDNGIVKRFKTKVAFKFFKYHSEDYIEEVGTKWEKNHAEDLKALTEQETIIRTSYKHMTYKMKKSELEYFPGGTRKVYKGKIIMDYHEYCPWWNDRISELWENYDIEAQEDQTERTLILDTVSQILKNIENPKKLKVDVVKGLFVASDLIHRVKKRDNLDNIIKDAVNLTKFIITNPDNQYSKDLYTQMGLVDNQKETEQLLLAEEKKAQPEDLTSFAYYCFTKLVGQDESKAIAVRMFLEGEGQREIRDKINTSSETVSTILKAFRQDEMGYLFEDWVNFVLKTNYSSPHNKDLPDCLYNGLAISCKCYADRSRCLTFYQNKELLPEYKHGALNNLNYFLILYNPWWFPHCWYIEIDPFVDNKVVIGPKEQNVHKFNMNSFAQEIFEIDENQEFEGEDDEFQEDEIEE